MVEQMKFQQIKLDQISITSRDRIVDEKAVAVLVASYEELGGFTTPIHVRKGQSGYDLIDGAHRLEAGKRLNLDEIMARVWTCSKAQAKFLEADANVSTADLSPVAMARSLASRHDAYLKLHPGTAQGVAGALAKNGQERKNFSFAEIVGEMRGMTPRRIRQIVQAGRALSQADAEALERAPKRVSIDDLSELAKVIDDDERGFIVSSLINGKAKKAAAARKMWKAENGNAPAPLSANDQAFHRLQDAWKRTPKAARTSFLLEHRAQLQEELDALPPEGDDA